MRIYIFVFYLLLEITASESDLEVEENEWRKDQVYKQLSNKAYQECRLPDGRSGYCRFWENCLLKKLADITKTPDYNCYVEPTKMKGVCCAEPLESSFNMTLAGVLPATAFEDETKEEMLNRTHYIRGCGLDTCSYNSLMSPEVPGSTHKWPWMAMISSKDPRTYTTSDCYRPRCGGALITDQHVITVAHCTNKFQIEDLYVRLGEYDCLLTKETHTVDRRVVHKREHEEFSPFNNQNDIAVLKLHQQVTFNAYVWPICLPPPGRDLANKPAVIIGWGSESITGRSSAVLNEATVIIWDHHKCMAGDTLIDGVFEHNICALGVNQQDACDGDSGGPLMTQLASGRWVAQGLVSWGVNCGSHRPGIYTRVDYFLDWILCSLT